MVIFRSGDGKVGYHQAETAEEAARFVERLRNHEGVEQARIFRLEEVTFAFRPYYRVELGDGAPAAGPPAGSASPGTTADESTGEPVGEDGPEAVEDSDLEHAGANGKRRFGPIGRL